VDGSSWEDAYFSVQDGLYEAREGGANIFVAEGIYTPDSDMFGNSIGDPNTTFQLINGVGLYGGFPSGGSDWESRSPSTYETILSGDLLLDDVDVNDPRDLLTEPTRADNSIHVVTGSGTDFTAILDGFTITAGNANGVTFYDSTGGGMFNYTGNPSVNNCTFSGNSAINGGGMASSHSSPIVIACVFTSNSSVGPGSQYGGGGMYNAGGSPIITNCTFSGNSAVSALDNSCGGGMYNNASELTVTNCVFSRNSADGGAGMYNNTYADATITNCTFSGNSANDEGGGMSNFNSDPIVVNCTFSGNSADSGGGMFNLDKSEPKITNCIFWANVAMSYGNEIYNASYWPLISYCDIEDSNGSGTGWDTSLGTDLGGNIDVDPLFFNSDANDFHLLPNSPCIDAGDNNVVSQSDDLDGLPRIVDGDCDITPRVDMGVYEFDWLYVGDFEGNDCDVDLTDFSVLADNFQQDNPDIDIAPFLNPDGIIDFKELQILCDNWLTQIP
jgi:hypothetical protein